MDLGTWIDHAESQVVQTSWAALALMSARYPCSEPIEKAVKFVMSRQASVRNTHIAVNCRPSAKNQPFRMAHGLTVLLLEFTLGLA